MNQRYSAFIIALIVFLIVPLAAFIALTSVNTGTRTVCKYGHTVEDGTTGVIVMRWNAHKYRVSEKTTVCEQHKGVETVWRKAKEAMERGDKEQAKVLFELAGQATAASGETGKGDGKAGSSAKGTGLKEFSGELSGLFPEHLEGYALVNDAPGSLTASRMYEADPRVHPEVALVTIEMTRQGKEKAAREMIDETIALAYGNDARKTSVNGSKAYFGTDGRELAVLAYQINGVLFKIEMLASKGSPSKLYDEVLRVGIHVP